MFAILVLMALFTTFMTTPSVMAIYKPARGISPHTRRRLQHQSPLPDNSQDELRVLACVHGSGNVPSLINLIESTRTTRRSLLKLFVMHLVELTDRSSTILMVRRTRKNGFPFINRFGRGEPQDQVVAAFEGYSQLGRVMVRPMTAISALPAMHEDICHVAEDKRVAMIVLPFHKQWRLGEGDEAMENVGHGWRRINQRVLENAPCSVAMLVDRGFGSGSVQRQGMNSTVSKSVCIVFFGGPDDREALELGGRMADHPAVKVTVARFIEKPGVQIHGITLQPSRDKCTEKNYNFSTAPKNPEREKELDDDAVAEFQRKWSRTAQYIEKVANNIVEEVLTIGQSGDYDLVVVGKGRLPSGMVAELADHQAEHAELGPIGDMLASSDQGVVASVLVIQQHDMAHIDESPMTKIVQDKDVSVEADESSV